MMVIIIVINIIITISSSSCSSSITNIVVFINWSYLTNFLHIEKQKCVSNFNLLTAISSQLE